MQEGAFYALATYGTQDKWIASLPDDAFDAKISLLKDSNYQRVYKQLNFKNVSCFESNDGIITFKYTIDRSSCDLINNVDIYIPTTKCRHVSLNDALYSIEVEIGGQRIDKIYSSNSGRAQWIKTRKGDINTLLNTNADVFNSKRAVRYTDKYIVIPLHMAPFHNTNLVFPSCKYHDMQIILEGVLTEICNVNDTMIYAECYYLDNNKRNYINNITHSFPTYQNQTYYDDCVVLKKGCNTFKLNFNHPVHSIYFWGFDKSKVKRVTLTLNDFSAYTKPPEKTSDTIYYDGALDPLEYYKQSRGISADPVFIFFSDKDIGKRPTSTINFSRLDYPRLTIETEQDDEPMFYLNSINLQGYRCMNGMFGLVYSK